MDKLGKSGQGLEYFLLHKLILRCTLQYIDGRCIRACNMLTFRDIKGNGDTFWDIMARLNLWSEVIKLLTNETNKYLDNSGWARRK